DLELMRTLAGDHELLVTVEEGVVSGGFGSGVWEALNDAGVAVPRILRIGLPDRYVTHGKPALLHAEVGFTGRDIARRVEAALFAGRGEVLSEA
ncbi:MAG: 1-deoxy-D-xylulose-5-phosphate synthase, partial [Baekduia sp.]|nr:1-deoxy-D-xylulose-5-phosphate synthase [Baekduia sp.]